MYSLAVCDDEGIFLENTKAMVAALLQEAGIPCLIEGFASADALADRLAAQPGAFDVLLLDILMPEQNGVALAKALRDRGYQNSILFVTSSKEFALEGYSVHPIHYLLKPLEKAALGAALLRDYARHHRPMLLSIPIKGGSASVPVDNVLYVESLNRSVVFHTKDRDIAVPMPWSDARALLPEDIFLQCHKAFFVHMGQIRDMTRAEVILQSGQALPVGRVYASDALSAFIEYMEKK